MKTGFIKTGFFKSAEHIKNPDDFKYLFRNGNKVNIFGVKLFYKKNNKKINRIGFPLQRGYGNAVKRNLSKRYSREVYRLLKSHLNIGYDMLILVYPGKDSFDLRFNQFYSLFKKAGLLKDEILF